jgi:UDP-N-acetylenolpyruvoylglucosamine reductase
MIKVVGVGAEVFKKHAGFIVNIEHATFKIDIETEVEILGEEYQKEDR